MMKVKKISRNLLVGVVIGIIAMLIINLQTTWLYYAVEEYGINPNRESFTRVGTVISIVIFITIVTIFKFKIKNITDNLIAGNIVGMVISLIITIQGSWLYYGLKEQGIILNPIIMEISMMVIVIIVFIISVSIFSMKRFEKINFNKISIYLLIAILISVIVATEIVAITITGVVNKFYLEENINIIKINLLTNGVLAAGIGTFILVFLALVNRKVKYIKFLTKEVKTLKEEGFGKTIEVKGKDEIAELCESINSMSLELKEKIDKEKSIEQNKNELISNVSHDLRTPLTSIIGYIDLLKSGQYNNEAQFNEYLGIIDEKSKSLNNLINELFEYTKLNNYDIKLNYGEVDIIALVEQIVGEYSYIFEKEGLTLVSNIEDKNIILSLDIEKFVRVLDNLLINAKKYSIRNTEVVVAIYEEENSIVISISNKTNEINEDDITNLFERFYKGDKSRVNNESSGLGLSIVKRIIELHHGEINAEFNNGIISFIIKIPK